MRRSLEGQGNNWKHNTMTSVEASEQKLRMYGEIDSSVYVDADTGLWYLAFLRDRGFSWDAIRDAQIVMNKMLTRDNEGRFKEKEDLFDTGPVSRLHTGDAQVRSSWYRLPS